jgi:hypothetical protein
MFNDTSGFDQNVFLTRVYSIIERDALIAWLAEEEIIATFDDFILSRKITSTMPDISYEGYSAVNDVGFKIEVRASDYDRAVVVLERFRKETAQRANLDLVATQESGEHSDGRETAVGKRRKKFSISKKWLWLFVFGALYLIFFRMPR